MSIYDKKCMNEGCDKLLPWFFPGLRGWKNEPYSRLCPKHWKERKEFDRRYNETRPEMNKKLAELPVLENIPFEFSGRLEGVQKLCAVVQNHAKKLRSEFPSRKQNEIVKAFDAAVSIINSTRDNTEALEHRQAIEQIHQLIVDSGGSPSLIWRWCDVKRSISNSVHGFWLKVFLEKQFPKTMSAFTKNSIASLEGTNVLIGFSQASDFSEQAQSALEALKICPIYVEAWDNLYLGLATGSHRDLAKGIVKETYAEIIKTFPKHFSASVSDQPPQIDTVREEQSESQVSRDSRGRPENETIASGDELWSQAIEAANSGHSDKAKAFPSSFC